MSTIQNVISKSAKIELFPEIEPYNTFHLKVSDIHTLYVEEVGNPEGQPVLFIHGGPGAGTNPAYRRLFDPKVYRTILFDQRGCGQSTPLACLEENTTWDLVGDIEVIRQTLGIDQWLIFGGSWGSTLGLAYAQTYPHAVSGMIYRAVFLGRPEEIRWLYQEGCSWFFPELWQDFIAPIPPERRDNIVQAYYELLTHPNETIHLQAVKQWICWDLSICKLVPYRKFSATQAFLTKMLPLARISAHYYANNMFFNESNAILANVDRIQHIPLHIIQGRYDMACPPRTAWELHAALPQSQFKLVLEGGHSYHEPGMLTTLFNSINAMAPTR